MLTIGVCVRCFSGFSLTTVRRAHLFEMQCRFRAYMATDISTGSRLYCMLCLRNSASVPHLVIDDPSNLQRLYSLTVHHFCALHLSTMLCIASLHWICTPPLPHTFSAHCVVQCPWVQSLFPLALYTTSIYFVFMHYSILSMSSAPVHLCTVYIVAAPCLYTIAPVYSSCALTHYIVQSITTPYLCTSTVN